MGGCCNEPMTDGMGTVQPDNLAAHSYALATRGCSSSL